MMIMCIKMLEKFKIEALFTSMKGTKNTENLQ